MDKKSKPVDLGALQDVYDKSKAQFAADLKIYMRAEEAKDRSREKFLIAEETLKAAVKTVLASSQG